MAIMAVRHMEPYTQVRHTDTARAKLTHTLKPANTCTCIRVRGWDLVSERSTAVLDADAAHITQQQEDTVHALENFRQHLQARKSER